MVSVAGIQLALSDMRKAIDAGKFQPINRKKNLDTLAQLGISWEETKDEIYNLEEKDYFSGPEADRDDPSSDVLWIFKLRFAAQLLYIKFKIVHQEDGRVKVISFHIDDPPK